MVIFQFANCKRVPGRVNPSSIGHRHTTGNARGLLAATFLQLPTLVGRSAATTHLGTAGISGALLWSGRSGCGLALETWDSEMGEIQPWKTIKNLWFCGENMRQMTVFGMFVDIWYATLRTNPHICWWFADDCWCFFEFEVCWRVLNCYRPALLMLSPSLLPKVSKVQLCWCCHPRCFPRFQK